MSDAVDDTRARAREVLGRVRNASLDQLVEPEATASVDREVVARWQVSDADRLALLRWGVPKHVKEGFFEHQPQSQTEPQIEWDDRSFYRIGSFNKMTIGVERGSGGVHLVPAGQPTRGTPFNSTLASYVECVWRWRVALPVLVELVSWAWDQERLDFLYRAESEVAEILAGIDPHTVGAESSLWREITDV